MANSSKHIRLPVCIVKALALINGDISSMMTDLPYWSCANITEVGELNRSVISAFEPWYNLILFLPSLHML